MQREEWRYQGLGAHRNDGLLFPLCRIRGLRCLSGSWNQVNTTPAREPVSQPHCCIGTALCARPRPHDHLPMDLFQPPDPIPQARADLSHYRFPFSPSSAAIGTYRERRSGDRDTLPRWPPAPKPPARWWRHLFPMKMRWSLSRLTWREMAMQPARKKL